MTEAATLPWRCPTHPDARVELHKEYASKTWNGVETHEWPTGRRFYKCHECGRELAPPTPETDR